MDADALIPELAVGASSSVSGLVTVMAAADAIGEVTLKLLAEYPLCILNTNISKSTYLWTYTQRRSTPVCSQMTFCTPCSMASQPACLGLNDS
jgi:hypothetical protein